MPMSRTPATGRCIAPSALIPTTTRIIHGCVNTSAQAAPKSHRGFKSPLLRQQVHDITRERGVSSFSRDFRGLAAVVARVAH